MRIAVHRAVTSRRLIARRRHPCFATSAVVDDVHHDDDDVELSHTLNELLETKRSRRGGERPRWTTKSDGTTRAVARARSVEEVRAIVLESTSASASAARGAASAAAVAALRRAAALGRASGAMKKGRRGAAMRDETDAGMTLPATATFEGADGEAFASVLRDSLDREGGSLSARTLARAFRDAAAVRFDAFPAATLTRAATERFEEETTLGAGDVTGLIWGMASFYRGRRMDEDEGEAIATFASAANRAVIRSFSTERWNPGRDTAQGATLCTALKQLMTVHRMVGGDVPRDTLDALLEIAASNAGAFSPTQVSFIFHDVVTIDPKALHDADVVAKLTEGMELDEKTPFSTISALMWCYAKADALLNGVVSKRHMDALYFNTRVKLETAPDDCTARDLAMNLYAVARLGPQHVGFADADYHDAICRALHPHLATARPKALVMISWALNNMRPNTDEFFIQSTFLQAVGEAVRHSAYRFAPSELAPTLHALVSLRVNNPKLLETSRSLFRENMLAFAEKTQNLSLMLWSFATTEYDVGKETLLEALDVFLDGFDRASPQEAKTIIQSLARLHLTLTDEADDLTHKINEAIEFHMHEYSKPDCEVLAWSLLQMNVQASETLLERVGVESVSNDAGDVEYVVHKPGIEES